MTAPDLTHYHHYLMGTIDAPFIKIHADYGWIGRYGWHNTIDCRPAPLPGKQWFRVWGMSCWFPTGWGPRGAALGRY